MTSLFRLFRTPIRFGGQLALFLLLLVLAAFGGGYLHYHWESTSAQRALEKENAILLQRQKILESMIDRLSRSQRLAQIVVTNQTTDNGVVLETEFLMVEIGEDGQPIAKQKFVIEGSVVYIDGLTIKFDPDSIAVADRLRGANLVLLRRVYSSSISPNDGTLIDLPGAIPAAYRVDSDEASQFECQLWDRFWELATDPALAEEYGVRVAQGEAVYKPLQTGVLYELTHDANGGMNLEAHALPNTVAEMLTQTIEEDDQ